MTTPTRLTLLGTGTPAPNPERQQSAVVLEIGDDTLLFDSGRGTINQMAKAGVAIKTVNPVFITHHHFDHISELFDVIITTALCGRTEPLDIYGPPGTSDIVSALLGLVYAQDIRSRIASDDQSRLAGLPTSPAPDAIRNVRSYDIAPGNACGAARWRVAADEVLHGSYPSESRFDWRCYGYRIETDDGIIAISGDTIPCDGITRLAMNADILVQCCHFPDSSLADDAVRHVTETTLPSAGQVGQIAAAAHVKHVVLTHVSMRVSGPDMTEALRADVQRHYDGQVTVGEDLMTFSL